MENNRLRVVLNRPQFEAFRLVNPGVLLTLVLGRGVGKSFLHRRIWYRLIAEWDGKTRPGGPRDLRGVRIILLCPTFKNAVDTYASAVMSELGGEDWSCLGARLNRTRWRIEFPGGSWIQFFGAENVDSARGMRCDVISVDEADDIEKSAFDAVAIPWLSEPWSLKIRVVTGTPRRGRFGLLYALYQAGKELDPDGTKKHPQCFSLHATYRDAPSQVSASYVETVRATMLPQVFDREWLASFDSGDRLVYPFEYDVHVKPYAKGTLATEWLVGVDFGWADAGVMLLCAVRGLGREATIHVVKEIYEHQRVESWWLERAREIKREYPNARWYADKSQPARIETLRRDAHVNIVPGENNIYDGIDAVADRLVRRKRPDGSDWVRLFVDPSCQNTIREFNVYRRKADPKDKERATDEIEDRDNHCLVAGTTVCTGAGQVPIELVAAGDVVLTRHGWAPVKASGMTLPSAEIWRAEFSNGRHIDGTANHKVWTAESGWVRLDALRYGATLAECPISTDEANPLGILARPIEDIQTQKTDRLGSTSYPSAGADCTEQYGSTTLGQSRMDITSITGTRTRSTMTSAISSACPALSMCGCITTTSEESGLEPTLIVSGPLPPRGTQAMREGSGTDNTDGQLPPLRCQSKEHASFAEPCTKPRQLTAPVASVPISANRSGADDRAPTTLIAPASLAGPASLSIGTAKQEHAGVYVQRVFALGRHAPVYDLTVDGPPEFYANGVLVHNSMDALRYAIFTRFGKPAATRVDLT